MKTVAQAIADRLEKGEFAEFVKTRKDSPLMDLSFKDAGTMTTPAGTVDNVYLPGITYDPFRRGRIRPLFPQGTMTGNSVPYVRDTGGEGAPAVVAEGGPKDQMDRDLALQQSLARKIAGYVRVSDEMLSDIPALSAFLSVQLIERIMDAEDDNLLYSTTANATGLTATAGVKTSANIPAGFTVPNAQRWDAILAGLATISSANYQVDRIAMNPTDLYILAAQKSTTEDSYIAPIFWNGPVPTLWGFEIYTSTAIDAGNLLMFDNRAAQLFQRDPINIRFSDQDASNFTSNLVTVRGEERLAFPVLHPGGVFYDSFDDIIAHINVS
jgi:HK97 family phage major capsid protein